MSTIAIMQNDKSTGLSQRIEITIGMDGWPRGRQSILGRLFYEHVASEA